MTDAAAPDRWPPVGGAAFAATTAGFAVLAAALAASGGFLPVLDHANLAFHEAGHPIFGVFGPVAGLYGGTLMQLLIPAAAAWSFRSKRRPVAFAFAAAWFFENFLNIARYMADARAQVLPLVGSGDHDWTNIFLRWNVMGLDLRIAEFTRAAGWFGVVGAWAWLWTRYNRDDRSGEA
jgi:hypothetical protein